MAKKTAKTREKQTIKKRICSKLLHMFLSYALISGLIKTSVITVKKIKEYETDKAKKGLPKYFAIFNNKEVTVRCELFKGGIIHCLCAGMTLDLSKAILDEDITIKCYTLMGGVNIIVPDNVKVEVEQKSILSGLSKEVPEVEEVAANTIYLKSNLLFSGLNIKS